MGKAGGAAAAAGPVFLLSVKKEFSQKRSPHIYGLLGAHLLAAVAPYAFPVVVDWRIGPVSLLEFESLALDRAGLKGYRLFRDKSSTPFGDSEKVYDQIIDGEKLYAVTKPEAGRKS